MAGVIIREPPSEVARQGDTTDENAHVAPLLGHHVRSATVVWVEATAGRCMLTDTGDFRQFLLSGPSADLWKGLEGIRSDDAVVQEVLAKYPDRPETAHAQCLALIDELTQLGLLIPQPRRES